MNNLTFLNNQFSVDNDRNDQIQLIKQLQEDIRLRELVKTTVKAKVREIYGNAVDCMSEESIQETYNDLTKI